MKSFLLSVTTALALVFFATGEGIAQADGVTVNISNVHLCCDKCVQGVDKAVGDITGVKATADKATKIVVLTAPDKATLQKAADALVAAGYFGESSDPDVKIVSVTGAKNDKVQTLKVADVHLCCPKCIKALNMALKEVPGVTTNDAVKGAKFFTITGDFNDADVFKALQKNGLTGKVAE